MTRDMMLKRKVGLLLVMLLTDYVAAMPLAPAPFKLDPVADIHTTAHPDDYPANDLESVADDHSTVLRDDYPSRDLDSVADTAVHIDDYQSNEPNQIKSFSKETGPLSSPTEAGGRSGISVEAGDWVRSELSAEEEDKTDAEHEDPDDDLTEENTFLKDDDTTEATEEDLPSFVDRDIDHTLLLREELTTGDLQERVNQIMQDFAVYEDARLAGDLSEQISQICGEDVLSAVQDVLVNLGDEEGVLYVLTAVALTQLHRCPAAAVAITSQYLATLDDIDRLHNHTLTGTEGGATVESEDKRDIVTTPDHCQFVAECEERDIPTVRQALSKRQSLLALYDLTASAVFSSSRSEVVGNAVVHDLFDDLGVPDIEKEVNRKRRDLAAQEFSDTSHKVELYLPCSLRISKRSSCVNRHEAKAQSFISWIPFIGTIYNLVSAAVYAGKGCNDVAKERAIEGTIDVAMDLASVATFGTGAAVLAGAKAAAKIGIKAGLKTVAKSAAKSAVKSLKKSVINGLKSTAKGYLNPVKGAITDVADAVKSVVQLVKAAPTIVKKGIHVTKKVLGNISKHINDIRMPKIPQPPPKVAGNVEDLGKAADFKGHPRCKRSSDCAISEVVLDKLDEQLIPRQSLDIRNRHRQRGDSLMKEYKIDTNKFPKKNNGEPYKIENGVDFTDARINNKDIFEGLQEVVAEKAPLFVKQNVGGVRVSYIVRRQPFPASRDQVVIYFFGTLDFGSVTVNGKQKAVTYRAIAENLDTFVAGNDVGVSQIAEAMLQGIEGAPSPNSRALADIFNGDSAAAQSAAEFIVLMQLAEAVPARIKGIDGYFRGGLRDLKKNGQSFVSFVDDASNFVTGKLASGRTLTNIELPKAERIKGLKGSNPEVVERVINQMSPPRPRKRCRGA